MKWRLFTSGKGSGSLAWPFLRRAALLSLVFLMVHLLGFRQYTCVLSGTASFGVLQQLGGALYLVFYGLFVILVPILLLAAGLARLLDAFTDRRPCGASADSPEPASLGTSGTGSPPVS